MVVNYRLDYDSYSRHNVEGTRCGVAIWGGYSQRNEEGMDDLDSFLLRQHGSYSLIIEYKEEVILSSDIIGSKPLFYCVSENVIYVADDALTIAKDIKTKISKDALRIFLSSGFIPYEGTLFDAIKQVLPGEYVRIAKMDGKIERTKYYEFDYYEKSKVPAPKLEAEFYDVLFDVTKDLIKRLDGRMAVVPLSGGLDSRTIAVMLKICGYNNVVCFSYGKTENREAIISKKIAEHLGYRWFFVEYNGEKWRKVFQSDEYKDFLVESGRGRSAGCIQGLPAILELSNSGVLDADSIVIPGHTLDVIAGSHLHLIDGNFPITREAYIKNLLYLHYDCSRKLGRRYWDKITESVDALIDKEKYVKYNQRFEYYNRQNKFVANDVRTYEAAGYQTEIPFWDNRVCDFWRHVPIEMLRGRELQKSFTENYIDAKLGDVLRNEEKSFTEAKSASISLKGRIKKILDYIPFFNKWGYIIYLAITGKYNSEEDWAAFWDMKKLEFFKYCLKYGQMAVNARAANDYISAVKREL